jgi:hypothetical protein
MLDQGWLARLEVRPGRDHECETLLRERRGEPSTLAFALRFGRSAYGLLELARTAGNAALPVNEDLLDGAPRSVQFTVIASSLPERAMPEVTRALLLTFQASEGRSGPLEDLLLAAQPSAAAEPGTAAWFALRFTNGTHGLFAAFADDAARFEHLAGPVPRELTRQALSLLAGVPDMDLLQVLAVR